MIAITTGAKTEENGIDLKDPSLYVNRELSLLEFQQRVFEEAKDPTNPLLERVKFLAILGSNLDEFFMVRVAGLQKQIAAGVVDLPPDGMTPAEQLAAIRKFALQLMKSARDHWSNQLIKDLATEGIHILNYDQLNKRQQQNVDNYFQEVVFPVLTPLAFDPGHPFPHISNLSLNLALVIRDIKGVEHFARVKVPASLPRLLPLKRSSGGVRKDGTVPRNHFFVWLEQVIAANLDQLFPGMEIIEAHPFRVTRDADMVIQELEASDLLETMEESVRRRRFGSVVRISVNEAMPDAIRNILIENLAVDPKNFYTINSPLGMSNLMSLYQIDRFELKYPPLRPVVDDRLRFEDTDLNLFNAIRHDDILIHHPYHSFNPVIDFLKLAARDPDVLAIKQTLYRVGKNSPIVRALLDAREHGKQVAVLVELKARFDEESNIEWAKKLERVGVHVIYGLVGLKTHSKIALVVRKEGEHIRRYVHLATGNYNAITAQLYEDIGMFTCDEEIGADATDLFNYLTGYSTKKEFRKLIVAPINMREKIKALIQREIDHQKDGKKGRLIFKMNSLVDADMIRALYKASQAGVQIDLFVRGICCLRPGLPGVSENIRVYSIVGRFLEHSRIYYFFNNGDEEIYLGSADLMPRNINRRVEVLFPVESEDIIEYFSQVVLDNYLKANLKVRKMNPDGSYERVKIGDKDTPLDIQGWMLEWHHKTHQKESKHRIIV